MNPFLQLDSLLDTQKKAFLAQPNEPLSIRLNNLNQLKHSIYENHNALIEAVDTDFGGRSTDETNIAEIQVCIDAIKYVSKHLKKWMRPSSRKVGIVYWPAINKVEYQPLGVVGIMSPWNYPIQLALVPLIYALASGNRAIIKPSELTPETNKVLQHIVEKAFPPEHVALVEGDADFAAYFSSMAWDHLIFTGSTSVGKKVMEAASKNLTPVTLELGGKSPALVCEDFNIRKAAQRICFGKCVNSGQTCVAPDYALVPKEQVNCFLEELEHAFQDMYPSVVDNQDYTSIISEEHKARLEKMIEDVKLQGANVIQLNPANEDFSKTKKLSLHLVSEIEGAPDLMQEEIFGPILPIITYDTLADALDFINDRPSPLALYCFSDDKVAQRAVLDKTHSGGVCINDTLFHLIQDDLPFGGVGESGMGQYHGPEGFLSLSKAKPIHIKGKFYTGHLFYPPLNTTLKKMLKKIFF
ncbi:coniferyl aldehyde dehydrogenase [Marinomonas mediterranea]|uniref:coniferyl aldehyde dehydrogenase n=1 Tax=Marinomonas mediterranea TaxID=119864 RepID=UPI00234AFAD9|nr:coniferyl aldehyde dehydrogenase [Marinomonas mediterranea]WCN09795.1 aldehyde dehydrogenase family protein [Marinomonas mediterranea]